MLEALILTVLGAWLFLALRFCRRHKGSCGGSCGECRQGCGHCKSCGK